MGFKKKIGKSKKLARAMNVADNKIHNSVHDFRKQELKKFGNSITLILNH